MIRLQKYGNGYSITKGTGYKQRLSGLSKNELLTIYSMIGEKFREETFNIERQKAFDSIVEDMLSAVIKIKEVQHNNVL